MARVVTIGGIKGGSGKTTIAINLAIMESQQGKRVLLVDADAQDTATDFTRLRKKNLKKKRWGYDTLKLIGRAVLPEVQALRDKYDTVIIDTGGGDTQSQRMALSVSDLFLIPFVPSPFDVWTVQPLDDMVKQAHGVNPRLQAFSFLNRSDSRGYDADEAMAVLSMFKHIQWSGVIINSRKIFSRSVFHGLGVMEWPKAPAQARGEISWLHNFMEEHLNAKSSL